MKALRKASQQVSRELDRAAEKLTKAHMRNELRDFRNESESIEGSIRGKLGLQLIDGVETVTHGVAQTYQALDKELKDYFGSHASLNSDVKEALEKILEEMDGAWDAAQRHLANVRANAWNIHERDKGNDNLDEAKRQCAEWLAIVKKEQADAESAISKLQESCTALSTKLGALKQAEADAQAKTDAITTTIQTLEADIAANSAAWDSLIANPYSNLDKDTVANKLQTISTKFRELSTRRAEPNFNTLAAEFRATLEKNIATRKVLETRAADRKAADEAAKAAAAAAAAAQAAEAEADEFETVTSAPAASSATASPVLTFSVTGLAAAAGAPAPTQAGSSPVPGAADPDVDEEDFVAVDPTVDPSASPSTSKSSPAPT